MQPIESTLSPPPGLTRRKSFKSSIDLFTPGDVSALTDARMISKVWKGSPAEPPSLLGRVEVKTSPMDFMHTDITAIQSVLNSETIPAPIKIHNEGRFFEDFEILDETCIEKGRKVIALFTDNATWTSNLKGSGYYVFKPYSYRALKAQITEWFELYAKEKENELIDII